MLVGVAAFSATFAGYPASAAPVTESSRLIETAPGVRHWMQPAEIDSLIEAQHAKGRCGGFVDVTDHPSEPVDLTREAPTFALLDEPMEDRELRAGAEIAKLIPELASERILTTVQALSTQFTNRYYQSEHGVRSQGWLADQYRALGGHRSDVSVKTVSHRFNQPSVIARIEGATIPNEIVVIGGHADSIRSGMPGGRDTRAPGADDNASGTSTVLETFRVLAQSGYRPDRTLEFMAYAGEEVGLLGSQDIAQQYRAEGKQVVAVLQLDMTFFPGSGSGEIALIDDHVDPGLTRFLSKLLDAYVHVPWKTESCDYACSDHASWTRAGYLSAFPFEAPMASMNRQIHTSRDLIESGLNASHGLHFAKLALAFALELSSGPGR